MWAFLRWDTAFGASVHTAWPAPRGRMPFTSDPRPPTLPSKQTFAKQLSLRAAEPLMPALPHKAMHQQQASVTGLAARTFPRVAPRRWESSRLSSVSLIRPSRFSSFDPWTVNASTVGRTWTATWSNWLFTPGASALVSMYKRWVLSIAPFTRTWVTKFTMCKRAQVHNQVKCRDAHSGCRSYL